MNVGFKKTRRRIDVNTRFRHGSLMLDGHSWIPGHCDCTSKLPDRHNVLIKIHTATSVPMYPVHFVNFIFPANHRQGQRNRMQFRPPFNKRCRAQAGQAIKRQRLGRQQLLRCVIQNCTFLQKSSVPRSSDEQLWWGGLIGARAYVLSADGECETVAEKRGGGKGGGYGRRLYHRAGMQRKYG